MKGIVGLLMWGLVSALGAGRAEAGVVEIRDDQLFVDGQAQPQLFGAELQYFRLRGGYGRNVPREKVIALWARALDAMVEAKMNAISFYIPWDFHEYAPGKFDFDGTVDEDGDGKPDYPSRDVKTFFKMVQERGFKHIMVRPGPYVNAEWGFLGFGAIPLWFHEKYPDSHMRTPEGNRTRLYDYHNPELLRHTRIWFQTVYEQVLKPYIGPGKPIDFLQIDNETNFMWQSIFNHDYGAPAVARYRDHLKAAYGTLDSLNVAHHRAWRAWEEVAPPVTPGVNVAEDQDWYRFQDESMHSYLHEIRKIWESLGVHEPDVLFTLAESYNSAPHGILPNYQLRNDPGVTGMMTVNLYPKTYETPDRPLYNEPFKSDHDVKAADSASDAYIGNRSEWVLGPEIQGGWWGGIEIRPEARRQTYLSTLGHGLKALFVYYFHEGDNWQSEWAKGQLVPIYERLRAEPRFGGRAMSELPAEFWAEFQGVVDREFMVGFDARSIVAQDPHAGETLYFDSPLGPSAERRNHYFALRDLGQRVIDPHRHFLGRATEVTDPVCLLRDVAQHAPSPREDIDSLRMNGEWMPGLLGYLMQAGINPRIVHWQNLAPGDLEGCRLIVRQDNGIASPGLNEKLGELAREGRVILNFVDDSLPRALGIAVTGKSTRIGQGPVKARYSGDGASGELGVLPQPLTTYRLPEGSGCRALMRVGDSPVAYRCPLGRGTLVQVGAVFHDAFNSDSYSGLTDVPQRRLLIDALLAELRIVPAVRVKGGGDRVVAFARRDARAADGALWITVKSGRPDASTSRIQLAPEAVDPARKYRVTELMSGGEETLTGAQLRDQGFAAELPAYGSAAYWIQ